MMNKEHGMTLVELIVAMLLSGIMMFIIGFLIVNSNNRWMTNSLKAQSEDEMRYAERRVEFMLRNASTEAFCADGSSISQMNIATGETNPVGDAVTDLRFNGNEVLAVEDGQLVYRQDGNLKEVLLRGVTDYHMYVYNGSDPGIAFNKQTQSYVKMYFATLRATANGDIITSSCTFIVKNRNNGN